MKTDFLFITKAELQKSDCQLLPISLQNRCPQSIQNQLECDEEHKYNLLFETTYYNRCYYILSIVYSGHYSILGVDSTNVYILSSSTTNHDLYKTFVNTKLVTSAILTIIFRCFLKATSNGKNYNASKLVILTLHDCSIVKTRLC